ncbi:putative nucleobase transporter [Trypanosoma rangeli]|uniref:Putative nucleobase transporter n=1 Tax=Trypanosoma rangeli TaxID=5698 RepID=A0A3R7NQR3_TRYRA|nr:putative nucleobase transporter [Trypanosoma rangeli]RNF06263.1 putative nucleobase transporter [Trypanosoma rangeli]|eukprot:RNF06263.1 putative nucleobase transporter [Trypanosoma rangeli]
MVLGFSSWAEFYVYATCILLGVSMLMPMNALTSAPRYMVDYYRYVTGNPKAEPNLPVFWANIFTFYNVVSLVTQIICGPTVLTRLARRLSLSNRFIFALTSMMLEVLVIVVLPTGKISQNSAIVAFIIVTIVAGAGKSYLEATCYVLAGTMPPKFMSAVMFGCGFSGLIASTMQSIIKASMVNTYESALTQAHIYFSLALGIMLISLIMALLLRYNSFAQTYVAEYRMLKRSQDEERRNAEVLDGCYLEEVKNGGNYTVDKDEPNAGKDSVGDSESSPDAAEANMTTAEQLLATPVIPVIKKIYSMQIACFCSFFLALIIFPSFVIPIDRAHEWFATIAVLCYNGGDAAGRFLTSFKVFWVSRRVTLYAIFARFLFIPLIFLCIYHYIPGHVAPCIFMFLIGLTNFFGALTMVYGPGTPDLKTDGERVMAGQLMGIALLGGASFASLVAMGVVIVLP